MVADPSHDLTDVIFARSGNARCGSFWSIEDVSISAAQSASMGTAATTAPNIPRNRSVAHLVISLSSHVVPARFQAEPTPAPPPIAPLLVAPVVSSDCPAEMRLGAFIWSSIALVFSSTSRSKYEVVEPSARFLYPRTSPERSSSSDSTSFALARSIRSCRAAAFASSSALSSASFSVLFLSSICFLNASNVMGGFSSSSAGASHPAPASFLASPSPAAAPIPARASAAAAVASRCASC
mmetsp:Transcript_14351/g.40369  ORF Transcript_14351/g.40369 Transcript_14351/m.40369 type:complete len:239 (-) Transcript_14351:751-1467(-)